MDKIDEIVVIFDLFGIFAFLNLIVHTVKKTRGMREVGQCLKSCLELDVIQTSHQDVPRNAKKFWNYFCLLLPTCLKL